MPPASTPGWQTADTDDDDCIEGEEICAPCQFYQYSQLPPENEDCDDVIFTDAGPVLPVPPYLDSDFSENLGECYTGACLQAPDCTTEI